MIRSTNSGVARVILTALGSATVCAAFAACSTQTADTPSDTSGGGNTPTGTSGSANTSAGSGTVLGNAGSGPVTGGAGASSNGGSTSNGTAGAASGSAGMASGGAGPVVPLCTNKITVQTPSIASFETYDGAMAASDFSWIFGGATEGMLGVRSSSYAYGDGSVEPTLAILAGHGGNYGLTVSVMNASKWGEGFGMFLLDDQYKPGCINASAYKGITMWVRGTVPSGIFSFTVAMSQAIKPGTTSPGGSCTGTDDTTCKSPKADNLPVSATWSQVNVLWADLVGGLSGPALPLAANGDNITGFSFGANLSFVPESEGSTVYVPVPGDLSIAVDDIAFIP